MWSECHFRWKLGIVSIRFWSSLTVTPMASDLNWPLSLEIGGIFRNTCSIKSLEISNYFELVPALKIRSMSAHIE